MAMAATLATAAETETEAGAGAVETAVLDTPTAIDRLGLRDYATRILRLMGNMRT
jgi:hypothetical protein